MIRRLRFALPAALPALLAACASAPATQPPVATQASLPATPPRDPLTAAAIERALGGAHRSAEARARDTDRHPLETLLLFGIRPDMTVAEAWPGPDGWFTEILAPLLAEGGKLYAAQMPALPGNEFVAGVLDAFSAKLAARPEVYGKVAVTTLGPDDSGIAPPESCDLVVSFGRLHDWMNRGIAPQALAAIHRALKPGGIFGIVDYRADSARPADPRATNGYVNEPLAIQMIEAAGFELVESSGINANPKDTRDHEQGVWALPPALRQGSRDRERLEAIGEADRFTLKFRRP